MAINATKARGYFAHVWRILLVCAMSVQLIACGLAYNLSYTPTVADKAAGGDGEELRALVRSGAVGPNEKLPRFRGATDTPFCLLYDLPTTEADLQLMIDRGADVNQRCPFGKMALQGLASKIADSRNSPEKIGPLYRRAEFLIDRGATLAYGKYSKESAMIDFKKTVEVDIGGVIWVEKYHAAEAEKARAEKARADKDSFFNVGALTTIAGMAVNNYATIKGAPSTSSLPIAAASNLQSLSSKSKQNQAATNVQQVSAAKQPAASQTNLATASSCLQAGTYGSKSDITPACSQNRNNTFGWGNTRAAACEGANRSVREEFDGKNAGGCYCQANAKVNSVTQPFVCWVMFD
jgi:hypothetical protein